MKRTDVHRPGAIVPSNYEYLMSYSLPSMQNGWPVPACGVQEALALEIDARNRGCEKFGSIGKCGVCGANYVHGDVWEHVPTRALVHLGHDCAQKYAMFAERGEYLREMGDLREVAAVEHAREIKRERCERFLAQYDGLADDLKVEHYIIADIASRFKKYGEISEKQVALVQKIAAEVRNPRPEETHVPAPEGRVDFRGELVSVKTREGAYGTEVKCTIKVHTDAGTWLAWGTLPLHLCTVAKKGDELDVTATLKRGRDAHFALMSRPNAALVTAGPVQQKPARRRKKAVA